MGVPAANPRGGGVAQIAVVGRILGTARHQAHGHRVILASRIRRAVGALANFADAIADLPQPVAGVEHPDWLHHVGSPGAHEYPGHTANELDRPAKTIKAGVHGVPGGEGVVRLDDGSIRNLTVREAARVMTFPDRWWLSGPRSEQMRQLGNAVPVFLARVVADSVGKALASVHAESSGDSAIGRRGQLS